MRNYTSFVGAAGIGWAVVNTALGFGTGQPPELDAPGPEVAAFLSDHRGAYLLAVAVFAATLPLLMVFVAELHRRAAAAAGPLASTLHVASATLIVGTSLAYVSVVPFLLGDGLGADATGGLVRYAYVLSFAVSMVANIGGAVVIAVASLALAPTARAVSLGVAGLVAACCVGGLVSPALAMVGGLGYFAIAIWAVFVGIGMIRRSARLMAPAPTVAAA